MTVTNSTAKTTTFLHDDDPFEEEQEISPGIYLSKLKSNSNNSGHQNSTPSGEEARKDYEVREPSIATRIHILQLQVDKLKYSNDEIIKVKSYN